ncbi:hypothetical protein U1708_20210 [Sphingomonas sp. ZB1N12]|uniref:hypothetical protein n=1 Tax=Sphingomonas arabinosi TaxID=3096160 RepID=UPI002FCB5857
MTQSELTTLADRLAEDNESQDRAKRIEILNQQIMEKSQEQHLAALNRLEGWATSPWILSGVGMAVGIALFSFGVLFTKFVILAH